MQEPIRVSGTDVAETVLARAAGYPPSTRYLAGFVAASDGAGQSFQRIKRKAAARAGIAYRIETLPDWTTQQDAAAVIQMAVDDPSCGGIVIQLPCGRLDAQALLDLVPAEKDPDVLGSAAYAQFHAGGDILPPAAAATAEILGNLGIDLAPLAVTVIGQGQLIGRPVSDWLESRCMTLHRLDKGFDASVLGEADLVILGTGAYVLDPSLLKPGAGVIDFGYRTTENGYAGDLDASDPEKLRHLAFYTPTPGGTGPVLVAALIENFVRLNRTA